jgi:hypothetical protein
VVAAVERYLECLTAHDWDGLAATLADDVVRDGPYRDVVAGKEPYVAFLRDVVPALPGYELTVQRVTHASDRVSYVELTEVVEVDGIPTEHPECILFERDDAGRIRYVSVFLKRSARSGPE